MEICAFLGRVGFSVGDPSGTVKSGVQNGGEEVTFRREKGFSPELGHLCCQSPLLLSQSSFLLLLSKDVPDLLFSPRMPPALLARDFAAHFTEESEGLRLFPSTHSFLLPYTPSSPQGLRDEGSRHPVSSLSQHQHLCFYQCLQSPYPFHDKMGQESVNTLIN